MIDAIVGIYRAVIVGAFFVAILAGILIFAKGGEGSAYGAVLGVLIIVGAGFALGTAAVLIAINDKLGKLVAAAHRAAPPIATTAQQESKMPDYA